MKKIILMALLLSPLFMQACQSDTKNETDKSADKQQEAVVQSEKPEKENNKDQKAAIHINEQQFKNLIMDFEKNQTWKFAGDKPCIVDFYADWCAPCRITSPILEELAKEYKGKIHVYKVDIDEEKKLASVFGIRSIPSFLYCPVEGKPSMSSGIGKSKEATKQMFKQNIEKLLLKN